MKINIFAFLLFISLSAKAQIPSYFETKLQTVFDSICEKRKIKGASVAVYIPNMGNWKAAHGISKVGVPIDTDMIFGIGSNTKTFIAVALLKMQEEGLINLDDKISTWISHPHVNGNITIRQLLNHTSGIHSYTSNPLINDSLLSDFNRVWEPEEMMGLVQEPLFAPGASWGYSNTNYLIAGMIIRDVLQQPLSQTIKEKILDPIQISETYLFPEESVAGNIPNVWSRNFTMTGKLFDVTTDFNYSNTAMFSMAWAAGAIMSTAEANAMFWHKLVSGQMLNAASMEEFQQFINLNSSTRYGLGLFQLRNFNGRDVISHGGTNIGFINENIADPVSGVAISVLTNQDSISNNILLTQLVRALHKITIDIETVGGILFNKKPEV
jgi:D-alanyl-D-alanine carboxypeptidase